MQPSSSIDDLLANIRDPKDALKSLSMVEMERLIAEALGQAAGESMRCFIHSIELDDKTGASIRLSLRVKGQLDCEYLE